MAHETGGYYSGYRCRACGYSHHIEECSGCDEVMFIDNMTPIDGDQMLCKKCNKKYE